MNLAISTSLNLIFDGTFKTSVKDEMAHLAKCGFTCFDFNFNDMCSTLASPFVGKDWQSYLLDVKKFADENGMRFGQAHSPIIECPTYEGCGEDGFRELQFRTIEGSALMGIPWLVFHPIEMPGTEKECLDYNYEYYAPFVESCKKYGVGLALENTCPAYVRSEMSKTDTLLALADSFHDDIVGICWDTGHGNVHGGQKPLMAATDQYKNITKIGERLKVLHVSDNTGFHDDHVAPFEGNIKWQDVMRALKAIDYKGTFNYEAHFAVRRIPACASDLLENNLCYLYKTAKLICEQLDA